MTDRDILNNLLDSEEAPTHEWVKDMQEKYPYFVIPSTLLLERGKKTLDREQYEELVHSLAIKSPDRAALNMKLGEDAKRFESFYPEEEKPKAPDTNSAIDVFLEKFGKGHEKEVEAIENAIFNPVPEYGLTLGDSEEAPATPKTKQDSLIDAFLEKNPLTVEPKKDIIPIPNAEPEEETVPEEPQVISTPEEREENPTFSESLASVYIKQKKYAKAYDILLSVSQQSSTHNPHIADQLRFLQKLINITKVK